MKEKARVLANTDMVASPDDVRQAIASLTEAESVKLRRMAEGASFRLRRKVYGADPKDILQEAMFRVLHGKRHWKPQKVDFVGLLLGMIKSIEFEWRDAGKRGENPVLETDLPATNSDGGPSRPFSSRQRISDPAQSDNSSRARRSPRNNFSIDGGVFQRRSACCSHLQ